VGNERVGVKKNSPQTFLPLFPFPFTRSVGLVCCHKKRTVFLLWAVSLNPSRLGPFFFGSAKVFFFINNPFFAEVVALGMWLNFSFNFWVF